MSNFKHIYDSISNPLNDDLIKYMIESFSKNQSIYSTLTSANVSNKQYVRQFYREIQDNFYAKLYKIWKRSFLSLKSEKEDVISLQKYLQNTPDIKTRKEFLNLVYGSEKSDLFEKYCWNRLGEGTGWEHISSKYLSAGKIPSFEVEHRLYLNTNSTYTEKLCSLFIDECDKRKIPFYFKYDIPGARDDTIVIYSNTEYLEEYINILKTIKKDNEDLKDNVYAPPILTGNIEGWIGYGSEPELLPNGERTSFNTKRATIFEEIIKRKTYNWIYDNQNISLRKNEKTINMYDYLSEKIVDEIILKYEKYIKDGNEKKLYDWYGIKKSDLIDGSLKKILENQIKSHIKDEIKRLKTNKRTNLIINIKTRNDKLIMIGSEDYDKCFNKMAIKIAKNVPSFVGEIKDEIIKESQKNGIDPEKICFDTIARDKLFKYSETKVHENINNNNNNNNKEQNNKPSIINSSNICDLFDPKIINCNVMFNNKVVNFGDYLKYYVFHFIPKDGFFTLKNGNRIPFKQFIEEYVLYDGQVKYNGNMSKILEATVKNNQELIILKDKIINCVEVTNFIETELLKKYVRYPNGAITSFKQYIEEYLAPYIPEDGFFILKNGNKIPFKQFIEEYVFTEGQAKYGGDISKLLEATTRNNLGNINFDIRKEFIKQQEIEGYLKNNKNHYISR